MNYIDEIAEQISREIDGTPTSDEWRPLFRLYALLCLVKGDEASSEDVYDAWSVFMLENREAAHKYLVPFGELPAETQQLDDPYRDAIQVVAEIRKGLEGEIVRGGGN